MIRMDRYDAFDKWDILCRYWADRSAVPDIGVDRLNRPRLPRWNEVAAFFGTAASASKHRLSRARFLPRKRKTPLP
jgi:hypothetical protein